MPRRAFYPNPNNRPSGFAPATRAGTREAWLDAREARLEARESREIIRDLERQLREARGESDNGA